MEPDITEQERTHATHETPEPVPIKPEAATPEAATPETATPEAATPETATPETATPETATPETATPETAPSESPEPVADANNNEDEDEYEPPCKNRYDTPIQQLEAIINLSPERRHYHGIKRIVESREAWSIVHPNGWLIDDSKPEQAVFYLWPAWEYAQMWLNSYDDAEKLGYSVRCMSLGELMLHILPLAIKDHVQLGSFYLWDEAGINISPEDWKTWVDELMVDWYGWDYIYEDEIPDYR